MPRSWPGSSACSEELLRRPRARCPAPRAIAARPASVAPVAPAARPAPEPPFEEEEPPATASAPAGPAEALLATMLSLTQARPTLAAPLRSANARFAGDALVLEVPPDFATLAREHASEFEALATKAAGRKLTVQFAAGKAPAPPPAAAASPELVRRQKLREEAEKEPAVQEALDLFDGRVVDVREAKPGREDA